MCHGLYLLNCTINLYLIIISLSQKVVYFHVKSFIRQYKSDPVADGSA